jgi:hypothetical protein
MHHEFFYTFVLGFDWIPIPWAGIGALLLGLGSALSGVAAIITARNRGREDETVPTAVPQSDADGGSGVSSSDSVESK